MPKLLKIGIVGCGTIGSKIAEAIISDFSGQARLSAVYDIVTAAAKDLEYSLKKNNLVRLSLNDLIKNSDLVIEAASAKISAEVARKAICLGRDCMILSVGGLLGGLAVFDLARKKRRHIYIPSGAICGIDGLKAHKLANIKKVTLTTRKPPQALRGAPYVTKNHIDLDNIKVETEIFKGSAQDAILYFPQNINIAATLSLAGIGKEKTSVRIISSPDYSGNTHELEIESDAGKTFVRCENSPSPNNPKTSFLAILSAIAKLREILELVNVGT